MRSERTGPVGSWLRTWGTRLTALALILVVYGFARLPEAPATERKELAGRFAFTRTALPEVPEGQGPERRTIRPVHPSLRHIAAWISSVGAAVAAELGVEH